MGNGNGHNGNGHSSEEWLCSAKQKELILKIIGDNQLDKKEIEQLAIERFGKSVKVLNKLEASGLIEELLEKYGDSKAKAGVASLVIVRSRRQEGDDCRC